VSEGLVALISSKPRVDLLKDCDPVELSGSSLVGVPKWTVLIGRTGFDTMYSIPDPTLGLNIAGFTHTCRQTRDRGRCLRAYAEAPGFRLPPVRG
jgi:hypothetical protein